MAYAGIDSHKDTLAVVVIDEQGRQVDITEIPNDPEGFHRLVGWLGRHQPQRVGIEGSGGHGRPAALSLLGAGFVVVEVPAHLTADTRRQQRSAGKTDPIDGLVIARVALREDNLPPVRPNGPTEDLRVMVRYRRELISERNRLANRIHSDLEQLHPGYQKRVGRLTSGRNLDRARRLLHSNDQVRARIARQRVTRLRQLVRQIDELTEGIRDLSRKLNTGLTNIFGVADLSAAELMAEIGDISRFRTRAHFAMANGTAPIPASSGRIDRHRLNRGGNRQLNRVIHYIALTQISRDPEGRAYYQRKQAEGKTRKEAIRCLKRRISDRIYRTLRAAKTRPQLT